MLFVLYLLFQISDYISYVYAKPLRLVLRMFTLVYTSPDLWSAWTPWSRTSINYLTKNACQQCPNPVRTHSARLPQNDHTLLVYSAVSM